MKLDIHNPKEVAEFLCSVDPVSAEVIEGFEAMVERFEEHSWQNDLPFLTAKSMVDDEPLDIDSLLKFTCGIRSDV